MEDHNTNDLNVEGYVVGQIPLSLKDLFITSMAIGLYIVSLLSSIAFVHRATVSKGIYVKE